MTSDALRISSYPGSRAAWSNLQHYYTDNTYPHNCLDKPDHLKQFYQLAKDQPVTICKKDKVTVEEWLDHTIHIRLRGKELNYHILPARPKPSGTTPWVLAATAPNHIQRTPYQPSSNHPWKRRIHADILAQQLVKG